MGMEEKKNMTDAVWAALVGTTGLPKGKCIREVGSTFCTGTHCRGLPAGIRGSCILFFCPLCCTMFVSFYSQLFFSLLESRKVCGIVIFSGMRGEHHRTALLESHSHEHSSPI